MTTNHRPPVIASEALAARPPAQIIAGLEIKIEAIISCAEQHAAKLARAAENVEREVDSAPHLEVEATGAEREARGYSNGLAAGLRMAARWSAEAAERAKRGGV